AALRDGHRAGAARPARRDARPRPDAAEVEAVDVRDLEPHAPAAARRVAARAASPLVAAARVERAAPPEGGRRDPDRAARATGAVPLVLRRACEPVRPDDAVELEGRRVEAHAPTTAAARLAAARAVAAAAAEVGGREGVA